MVKILIVDDLSVDRFLLKSLLNSLLPELHIIADIHEAECGTQALEEAKITSFDLIFMDIVMPVLDGIEATKQIRAFDKKAVIFGMSSMDDQESEREIIQAGADHFIEKPLYGDVLTPLLEGVISQIEKRKSI